MQHNFNTAWATIDQSSDPTRFLHFMDTFGTTESNNLERYQNVFKHLKSSAGQHILEVGCGRGNVVRALAHMVGEHGYVVGIDLSKTMIDAARERSQEITLPVEFLVGDAHHLPFADHTFDGCYSGGLFEIIRAPQQALREMHRVAKAGARVLVVVPDYGTLAIASKEKQVTRKLIDYFCDHEVNGWIGRQFPGFYRRLGFVDISIEPQTLIFQDYQHFQQLLMSSVWMGRAQASGAVSSAELSAWWSEQDLRAKAGLFFCSLTCFFVSGNKADAAIL